MIALALLLAAAPGLSDAQRFDACAKRAESDPQGATIDAKAWAGSGGGVPAGQCLGLAQTAAGDWRGAADSFAATADLAERTDDGRAADLWVSAANAALGGGDAARARGWIDRAVALPTLADQMRGEAMLDRARADVALAELPQGRTDMDKALALVPRDPMAWLLSAALARRMDDLARARRDIVEAAARAPTEPAILLESGDIYAAAGDVSKARGEWARARDRDSADDAGKTATERLAATGGLPPRAPQIGR